MNIYLKVTKTIALKVTKCTKISTLKLAMRVKEGISETFQELYYGGERLNDDGSLADCGIHDNSTLHLVLQTSELVKLTVRISTRQKTIVVEAKRHDTIHKIKSMIQAKQGIHSDTFTLLYTGKLLEDSRTLASLGIKDEATLNLVFNPKDAVTLSVKLPTEEIVKTEVKIWYTVSDVKEIVGSIFGVPVTGLVSGGKELEDSLTLASYNVNEESILEVLPRAFYIFVKLPGGKMITLDHVCQHDTILSVKRKIIQGLKEELGNSPECYYLVYAGTRLEDDQNVGSARVEKQCTISIRLK